MGEVVLSLSIYIIMDSYEIIKNHCTNGFTQQWGGSTAPCTGQDMPKLSAYKKKESSSRGGECVFSDSGNTT